LVIKNLEDQTEVNSLQIEDEFELLSNPTGFSYRSGSQVFDGTTGVFLNYLSCSSEDGALLTTSYNKVAFSSYIVDEMSVNEAIFPATPENKILT
jgi:hypothetical protein